jgi:CheY-like chemotaxis protein
MLVEDHDDTRRLYEMTLSLAGFSVTAVGRASVALRLYSSDFDAIVTDLAMPEMSGAELVERIRSDGSSNPVLVVTRQSHDLAVQGACAVLSKPCEPHVSCGYAVRADRALSSRLQPVYRSR